MPAHDVKWFRTVDHYWFLAVGGGWAIGVAVAWWAFPWGPSILVGGAALSLALIVAVLSGETVMRVGLTRDEVVLRRPFWSLIVRTSEVESLVLDPPVQTVGEGVAWWRRGSRLEIRVSGRKKPLVLSNLPEGLKLRVARVLDHVRHPGDPFEAT